MSVAMRRDRAVVRIALAVMLAICFLHFTGCQGSIQNSTVEEPLFGLLKDEGVQKTPEDWYASLSDEEKASLDVAYETSVTFGYEGTQDEWLTNEVYARFDSSGDLVVIFPDGGELTILENAGGEKAMPESEGAVVEDSRTRSVSEDSGYEGEKGSAESGSTLLSGNPSASALVVESVKAHSGDDNVLVAVRVANNPGLLGLTLSVSYDESALALISAENGEAFKGVLSLTRSPSLGSGCVFTWDGVDLAPDDARDGAILNLYFKVLDGAKIGHYPIVLNGANSALTNDLREIALEVQNGSVDIE